MDKQAIDALCATYESWKANRRFLVGDVRPSTPWAKRRKLAESRKRFALARANRRFVIKA